MSIAGAVVTVGTTSRTPLLIVKNTNQMVTLRRWCQAARLNLIDSVDIICALESKRHHVEEGELEEASVREEFRVPIHKLLKKNKGLFVKKEKDLGRKNTVKMRINTNGHVPIKRRPYRTPPHSKKTDR